VLLVDRYKYLDLYPCSQTELTVIGYEVSMQRNGDIFVVRKDARLHASAKNTSVNSKARLHP
jgi:hypothetical protein